MDTLASPSALLEPSFQAWIPWDSSRQNMKWVKCALLKFRDVSCFLFYSLHLASWAAPVHGQCSQAYLQPSNHGHFCLVCKFQVQHRTLPCCLPDHLYQEIVTNTLTDSLWAIQLPSQKLPWLMFPRNQGLWMKFFFQLLEGSLSSIFNPRHLPQHHPQTPDWVLAGLKAAPHAYCCSQIKGNSVSLPSQPALLEMLSLLIIALHHVSLPTMPPQSWWGHSPVAAQGLLTTPFALKQICCITEALHTSPRSCKTLKCTTSTDGPIWHQ